MSLLLLFGQSEIVSPSVTSQPSSTEVYEGQTATFTVAATGGGLSYQWQKSDNAGVDWSNISGATSSSYTTAATVRATDNDDQFRCVVTNSAGTVNSNAATLTVWNPLAVASLARWLDGSDNATVLESIGPDNPAETTDPVRRWVGKNSSPVNADQATAANQPLYQTGVINSKSIVRFDGTNDFMEFASLIATSPTALTIFVVASSSTVDRTFFAHRSESTRLIQVNHGSGNVFRLLLRSNTSSLVIVDKAISSGVPFIGTACMDTSGHSHNVWVNGDPGTPDTTNFSGQNFDATRELVGATDAGSGVSSFLNGDFAELIIYSAALSESNREKVEGYLSWKWGITLV